MKTPPSLLLLAAILSFLGVMRRMDAAPAPPAVPGQPKVRLRFRADSKCINSMEFSSDGKKLLSLGFDGLAKIWDVRTGKHLATLKGQFNPGNGRLGTIGRAALSPNGNMLATAEYDRSVRLWDVATGKKVATLTQPVAGSIPAFLLFSPDGKYLLSLGRAYYLWDLEAKKMRVIAPGLNDDTRINYLRVGAFDPKGQPLVLIRDNPNNPPGFDLWTMDSTEPAVTFRLPIYKKSFKGPVALAFSRDCKTIASADGDWTVRLWDAATGKNTAAFAKLPGRPFSLAYSPDGKVLAVGSRPPRHPSADPDDPLPPPSVRLYEIATGKVLATLPGNPSPSSPLVFSPDGRTLATGDGGPEITLWSLPARYVDPK